MSKLDSKKFTTILNNLTGLPLAIYVSFGGVLLGFLGGDNRDNCTVYLFADETWFVKKGNTLRNTSKKIYDRWENDVNDDKGIEDEINGLKIKNVTVSKKETIFNLEKNYSLHIINTGELRTWSLTSKERSFDIDLNGDDTITENYNYQPEEVDPEKHKITNKKMKASWKKHQKLNSDPLVKEMYQENMPLSPYVANKLIQRIIGQEITNVEIDTATTFTINTKDNKLEWWISVNDSWKLEKGNELITDSTNKFTFIDSLSKVLLGSKVIAISFNDKLESTIITFDNKHILTVNKTKDIPGQSGIWTISCNTQGWHINASRSGELDHIITVPDHLKNDYHYDTKGSNWACVMYALDFYREFLSK